MNDVRLHFPIGASVYFLGEHWRIIGHEPDRDGSPGVRMELLKTGSRAGQRGKPKRNTFHVRLLERKAVVT